VSLLCAGIRYVITDRNGGVSADPFTSLNLSPHVGDDASAVAANRKLAAARCGLDPADLAWMHQVHGAEVRYAGRQPAAGPADDCDAIFTDMAGLALAVQVADCVPVLVADPQARLAGAAHAGRAGMVAGVVPGLVAQLSAAGGRPDRMHALIGPAICGGCYEVGERLRAEVSAMVPESGCVTRAGTAGLDITAGVAAQLAAVGVGSVSRDGRCTRESDELYSYRRDGTTGRFAALVWMEP
jgi:purine-nucleoside/S-methyl-5'-thioadenosine phosphorylase / adenosine deaminase